MVSSFFFVGAVAHIPFAHFKEWVSTLSKKDGAAVGFYSWTRAIETENLRALMTLPAKYRPKTLTLFNSTCVHECTCGKGRRLYGGHCYDKRQSPPVFLEARWTRGFVRFKLKESKMGKLVPIVEGFGALFEPAAAAA